MNKVKQIPHNFQSKTRYADQLCGISIGFYRRLVLYIKIIGTKLLTNCAKIFVELTCTFPPRMFLEFHNVMVNLHDRFMYIFDRRDRGKNLDIQWLFSLHPESRTYCDGNKNKITGWWKLERCEHSRCRQSKPIHLQNQIPLSDHWVKWAGDQPHVLGDSIFEEKVTKNGFGFCRWVRWR